MWPKLGCQLTLAILFFHFHETRFQSTEPNVPNYEIITHKNTVFASFAQSSRYLLNPIKSGGMNYRSQIKNKPTRTYYYSKLDSPTTH